MARNDDSRWGDFIASGALQRSLFEIPAKLSAEKIQINSNTSIIDKKRFWFKGYLLYLSTKFID